MKEDGKTTSFFFVFMSISFLKRCVVIHDLKERHVTLNVTQPTRQSILMRYIFDVESHPLWPMIHDEFLKKLRLLVLHHELWVLNLTPKHDIIHWGIVTNKASGPLRSRWFHREITVQFNWPDLSFQDDHQEKFSEEAEGKTEADEKRKSNRKSLGKKPGSLTGVFPSVVSKKRVCLLLFSWFSSSTYVRVMFSSSSLTWDILKQDKAGSLHPVLFFFSHSINERHENKISRKSECQEEDEEEMNQYFPLLSIQLFFFLEMWLRVLLLKKVSLLVVQDVHKEGQTRALKGLRGPGHETSEKEQQKEDKITRKTVKKKEKKPLLYCYSILEVLSHFSTLVRRKERGAKPWERLL